ncbi:hypothetical protein CEXT_284721 [Caerostris extrusa]|uniref:Uncharacterized protein n=1 Tax=Caerostris extrusa TaxID=172846 RepID=A0AAV4QDA8_CAEEX|nr:hypothetical protein CEXT_284721 [Caerostris extrusa]
MSQSTQNFPLHRTIGCRPSDTTPKGIRFKLQGIHLVGMCNSSTTTRAQTEKCGPFTEVSVELSSDCQIPQVKVRTGRLPEDARILTRDTLIFVSCVCLEYGSKQSACKDAVTEKKWCGNDLLGLKLLIPILNIKKADED